MKKTATLLFAAAVAAAATQSCGSGGGTLSGLSPEAFDTTANGKKVQLFTLKNEAGMEVCITNYGARVVSLMANDNNNQAVDVVLGHDNIAQYMDTASAARDMGALVGRYSGLLAKGTAEIGGEKVSLEANCGKNYVDGGRDGWQWRVFDAAQPDEKTLVLTIKAGDGEGGLPGNVDAKVTYTLTDDNALECKVEATADKATALNPAPHIYFNLMGNAAQPCTNMVMHINADKFATVDTTLVPTGELRDVYGTPLDFTKRHALYESIADTSFQQVKYAGGFNHYWCLNTYDGKAGNTSKVAASLYSQETGVYMEVFTNAPGLQAYTSNGFGAGVKGKGGVTYPKRSGVMIAPQQYPDAFNHKGFNPPVVKPGEKQTYLTTFKFSVK